MTLEAVSWSTSVSTCSSFIREADSRCFLSVCVLLRLTWLWSSCSVMDRSGWSEASAAAFTSLWRHLRLLSCDRKSTQVALKTSTFFVPASERAENIYPFSTAYFFLLCSLLKDHFFMGLWAVAKLGVYHLWIGSSGGFIWVIHTYLSTCFGTFWDLQVNVCLFGAEALKCWPSFQHHGQRLGSGGNSGTQRPAVVQQQQQ